MNRILFLFLFIIFLTGQLRAQLNNEFFYDMYDIQEKDSGNLFAGFEAFGFLVNNEFKQNIIPGYTLFGYQFRPYVSFFPSGNIRLEAGGFLMKDFGESDFSELRPVFTIAYKKNGLSMIFGSIEGSLSHRLIEPVYDFENIIDRRIEDGFQLKYIKERIFIDTWIEWINMIGFGDPEQEEFNAGTSMNFRILDGTQFDMEIPFQLLVNHTGGQIDTNDAPAGSIFNPSAGISLIYTPLAFLRSIRSDNYYVIYEATEPTKKQPALSGSGYYFNLTAELKWFDLMISYWKGEDYYSPFGGSLYQSVSFDHESSNYYEEKRNLLIGRILYEYNIGHGLSLSLRFQPLYDLENKLFEHMESLYLRYRTDFTLNRKRQR